VAKPTSRCPGFAVGTDQARFIAKARGFLRQHLDHVAVAKLRMNRPLTSSDLAELERLLEESGVGGPDDIRRAGESARGLGLLVRSLVGMDRAAAKEALTRWALQGGGAGRAPPGATGRSRDGGGGMSRRSGA
jgi:type I restriction enzyme R subunit